MRLVSSWSACRSMARGSSSRCSTTPRVDAVVVTAAHQYPTGAVLLPERRAALVAWAARLRRLRHRGRLRRRIPLRPPAGRRHPGSRSRTASSTPGPRARSLPPGCASAGWPSRHASGTRSIHAKKTADQGSPAIDQLAFADLIERGELDHHLRRVRPIYRERRDALLEALERHLPRLRPVGASAGLHVLAWLPDDIDEERALEAAGRRGIALVGVGCASGRPGRSRRAHPRLRASSGVGRG